MVFKPREQEIYNKNHFSHFCPKRFNRYPRFTIFFRKDGSVALNPDENMVSLSPEFLQYLMENKIQSGDQPEYSEEATNKHAPVVLTDGVTSWNLENEGQSYDPFSKVVLVKGIDNSILTSFRTLKRENNTVSETFKVVHNKFLPNK